jgi:multicomponent Na+:H+ antiporter subunit G
MMNLAACFLIGSGLLFFIAAVVGILRFPDFYSRMHAAGKGDTLSTLLVISGAIVYYLGEQGIHTASLLVAGKMALIFVFILIASPTATHALTRAGLDSGIEPLIDPKGKAQPETPKAPAPKS